MYIRFNMFSYKLGTLRNSCAHNIDANMIMILTFIQLLTDCAIHEVA